MLFDPDNVYIGLAWDPVKTELMLEDLFPEEILADDSLATLPIIVLAKTASDEETACAFWRQEHPGLEVNTVFPLSTLLDQGAVS